MTIPTSDSFRDVFAKTLSEAGFQTKTFQMVAGVEPVVLAESPYYMIAFQVFDIWGELFKAAGRVELALSDIITKSGPTDKNWDAYLVLVCRNQPHGYDEMDELSNLIYDTRVTRKIIRAGIGDSLEKVKEAAKPFVSLEKARYTAKHRNPLDLLENKLVESGSDRYEVGKLITVFKERGSLENVQ